MPPEDLLIPSTQPQQASPQANQPAQNAMPDAATRGERKIKTAPNHRKPEPVQMHSSLPNILCRLVSYLIFFAS